VSFAVHLLGRISHRLIIGRLTNFTQKQRASQMKISYDYAFLSTFKMIIAADKQIDALKILQLIALQVRDEPDCLDCLISRDTENSDVLIYQEYWKSEESLNKHICSREYRNLLLVIEMSLEQPEIRFDTISNSTGIETIEQIRSASRLE
jgi:quinol monooxygenase YgiN